VLALDNGLHGFDPATEKLSFLVHAEPDEPDNCYNDGRCDTLYVTSATAAPKPGQATPASMEGGLLALHVGVRGLPEAAFAG